MIKQYYSALDTYRLGRLRARMFLMWADPLDIYEHLERPELEQSYEPNLIIGSEGAKTKVTSRARSRHARGQAHTRDYTRDDSAGPRVTTNAEATV